MTKSFAARLFLDVTSFVFCPVSFAKESSMEAERNKGFKKKDQLQSLLKELDATRPITLHRGIYGLPRSGLGSIS